MWFYNDKLKKWFHPSGATSENGPNDPPAEVTSKIVDSGNPAAEITTKQHVSAENRPTSPCVPCGHKEPRKVR